MRSVARDCVYKFLFSKLFNSDDEGLFGVLCKDLSEADKKFASALLEEVTKNEKIFLQRMENLVKNYQINRIHKTDKISLLIGMAEFVAFPDTPIPVVIDEAVNLSAKYSGEGGASFVNGILGKYIKMYR